MEVQNVFKLLAILATAVVGVYGTVFDFKRNGRVTRHGIIATTLIVAAAAIAVVIHVSGVQEARLERARLQRQNGQQRRALQTYFDRLSRPLNDISFSYDVIYDHADQRFPKYYQRLLKLERQFERHSQEPTGGPLSVAGIDAYAFSNLDGHETDHELNFEFARIGFRSAAVGDEWEPQRKYEVEAWIPGAENFMKRELASGNLHKMSPGVRIEIAVDFGTHTLTKIVRFAAVRLIQNDGTITSELDIAGPDAAKNLIIEVERPSQDGFKPPSLSELVIHFNAGAGGNVYLPGSACQPSQDSGAVLTCTMRSASVGSPHVCPVGDDVAEAHHGAVYAVSEKYRFFQM
jgi:hypothetical protein